MKARAVLKEVLRRKSNRIDYLDPNFPAQNKFILDQSRKKAAICTRRAGKSRGVGNYICKVADENPGVSIGYIALTSASARKIMFKDILKVINREKKVGMKFNEVDLTVKFPNGCVLYMAGADAGPDEIEKWLGQKFKLVVIDESASFKQDLRRMVYEVLWPAMTDLDGTIVLIGTPRNNVKSFFFDVTNNKEPGWSVHKWSALENPYVKENFQAQMDDMIRNNPRIVETPTFKQMWLGEWAIDTDALVYKYKTERNTIDILPKLQGKAQWYYVLGVDLGFSPDPSAFVVGAYNEYDSNLYFVETFKKTEMDLTDVANKIKYFQKRYPIHKIIVDNAAKQSVEEIKKRHELNLVAAEKTNKVDFIEIMNDDFIQGRIKILQKCIDDADPDESIADEYTTLVWDEKSKKKQENGACPNHFADAALYLWRYCYNYLAQKHEPPPDRNSKEYIDKRWEEMAKDLEADKHKPFWEKDFE